LNSAFNIFTPGAVAAQCSLLIEVSCYSVSYIVINEHNACVALAIYHFADGTTSDQLGSNIKNIVAAQPLLQQPFKKITIVYAFEKAILIPNEYMSPTAGKKMLELAYGDTSEGIVRSEHMYKHNLHTCYEVPKEVDAVIAHLFPIANHTHQYALLPNVVEASGNLLYCIFNPAIVTVQLFKMGKLQVIQSFQYKTAEDAAYHLLNVCQRFDMVADDTILYLNGMIDAASNLNAELNNYFLHPAFGSLPIAFTYNSEIKKYPEHYFSHLFQLATCV